MSEQGYEGLDIVVVDMTHGGSQLCREYAARGASVFAVDSHATLLEEEKALLGSCGIVMCNSFQDALAHADPALVVMQYAPDRESIAAYCGKNGVSLISHARATGNLLAPGLCGKEVVEITGGCGKTSVSTIVSSVLRKAGRSQLVVSSSATSYIDENGVRILDDSGSITPSQALRAVGLADACGLRPDSYVFEVSLGGLGIGRVGAVLNVPLHIRAGIGRSAFFSKCQMAENLPSGSILCLSGDDPPAERMRHLTPHHANVFSTRSPDAHVVSSRSSWYPEMDSISLDVRGLRTYDGRQVCEKLVISPDHAFFGHAGASNIAAAAAITLSLGIAPDKVCDGICAAHPPEGRLSATWCGPSLHIRSTATSREAVMSSLEEARRYASFRSLPLDVVLGGKPKTTCGYIDFAALSKDIIAFSRHCGSLAIFGGLGDELSKNGVMLPVHDSYGSALQSVGSGDNTVVVSCVNM